MMKVTQKADKHIKVKELQRNFSRKSFAPKKTSHHQMKMKSVTVKQGEFYSWLVEDSDKEDSEEEYEESYEEEIEEAEVEF
jgi:hypothetical protein